MGQELPTGIRLDAPWPPIDVQLYSGAMGSTISSAPLAYPWDTVTDDD